MLTPAATGRQGHVINASAEWSARHEVELQEAMRAAYIAQSTRTVAGRRAEYQSMGNGIDKGFNVAQTSTVTGE